MTSREILDFAIDNNFKLRVGSGDIWTADFKDGWLMFSNYNLTVRYESSEFTIKTDLIKSIEVTTYGTLNVDVFGDIGSFQIQYQLKDEEKAE